MVWWFMVKGYKCFNSDMSNCYGFKYNIGNIYYSYGDIKFGINGNGFHMCKNLVDVFRYFNCFDEDVIVCEVIGSGKIDICNDEYNGFYDLYAVECLEIVRKLDRSEIIDMVLNMNYLKVI